MKALLAAFLGSFGVNLQALAALAVSTEQTTLRFRVERLEYEGIQTLDLKTFMQERGWELNHEEAGHLDFRCFDCVVHDLPSDLLQMAADNEHDPTDVI